MSRFVWFPNPKAALPGRGMSVRHKGKESYLSIDLRRAIKEKGPLMVAYNQRDHQLGFRHCKKHGYVGASAASQTLAKFLNEVKLETGVSYVLEPCAFPEEADYVLNLPRKGGAK